MYLGMRRGPHVESTRDYYQALEESKNAKQELKERTNIVLNNIRALEEQRENEMNLEIGAGVA